MKKLVIILLSIASLLAWEVDLGKHSFSMELGGTAAIYGARYQYDFISTDLYRLGVNVGAFNAGIWCTLPIGVEVSYGKTNQLLLGISYDYTLGLKFYNPFSTDTFDGLFYDYNSVCPKIGYKRLIPGKLNTFFLQAYFSPIIMLENLQFIPMAGLGIGFYLD